MLNDAMLLVSKPLACACKVPDTGGSGRGRWQKGQWLFDAPISVEPWLL